MTVLLQRYNHHVRPPKLASACSSRRYFRERATAEFVCSSQLPCAQISTMSELFVSWDDLLTEAETALTRLEKARDQPLDIS